ncbi:hypothetical protein L6164_005332 [Bauhinia variegata]|uniref:Uncharacterized protein n=1 Tax=Bauhinia variegata TaxID=167791 RepID=A0ACB9PSV4_BAUVA|nr:hypothetical protein L6164_005332 [Bauhinia variegata]
MAMGPERSKPLHNFSLPCLKWGNQRFLRCVKVPPNAPEPSTLDRRSSRLQSKFDQSQQKQINHPASESPTPNPFHNSKRKSNTQNMDSENNIEAVHEKLMTDLRVAAKKLKVSIFEEQGGEDEAAANARPWNLRTRRAACKAPNEEERKFDSGSSPMKVGEAVATKEKPKPVSVDKNEKVKLSVSLSKEEVEQDFFALLGTRPPRRPKKRPRVVQRQLDSVFPGLWLTEVTTESYKVPDVPE